MPHVNQAIKHGVKDAKKVQAKVKQDLRQRLPAWLLQDMPTDHMPKETDAVIRDIVTALQYFLHQ